MRCQSCKRRKAVYRVGSDGFNSRSGAYVCDNYVCRLWADGGYPVTFKLIKEVKDA
jgi:hypothetical protein